MYQKRPYERAPDRPDHRACHDMTDGRACTPLGGTLILRVRRWARVPGEFSKVFLVFLGGHVYRGGFS